MPSELDTAALMAKDVELARIGSVRGTVIREKIQGTFDDTHAHAFHSLTKVIRETSEGRPTVAAVRRSRSYVAARTKLENLTDRVCRLIEAARVELYSAAYRGWCQALPDEYLRSTSGEPTAYDVERFRTSLIGTMTIRDDIGVPVARAVSTLEQTLILAGSRTTNPKDSEDLLDGWLDRAMNAVLSTAQGALEDSLYRADYITGRSCLKPELLHPDPTLDE